MTEAARHATIELERRLDAPVSQVFQAWVDPEARRRWGPPSPSIKLEYSETDFRVGGRDLFTCVADDNATYRMERDYREILDDQRIVFVDTVDRGDERLSVALYTLELAALAEQTDLKLTMQITGLRDGTMIDGHQTGWGASLDNLQANMAREVVITRLLDAPVELVWQAWTEPEKIAAWWGPRGLSTRVETLVFEVGGRSRLVMRNRDGVDYPIEARFLQIEPHQRIVMAGEYPPDYVPHRDKPMPKGMISDVRFESIDDSRTRLTITARHADAEEKAKHLEMGLVFGWNSSFDCLEEHLGVLADDAHGFTLVRRLAAPRSLVFACWAQEQHMRVWCCPMDFRVSDGGMKFAEGGDWHMSMHAPDNTRYRLRGRYRKIVDQEMIVFTQAWIEPDGSTSPESLITVRFEDDGEGTKLTFRQTGLGAPDRRDSHAEGWRETLDNLDRHLARQGETVGASAP